MNRIKEIIRAEKIKNTNIISRYDDILSAKILKLYAKLHLYDELIVRTDIASFAVKCEKLNRMTVEEVSDWIRNL